MHPVRFLSGEWLEQLNGATSSASPTIDLCLRQRVTGGPDGDTSYLVRVAGGRIRFEPGATQEGVDVELISDYDTAAAISQGRLSPASAFAAGRLRVGGAISSLVTHQEALASIGALLAGMADATTY